MNISKIILEYTIINDDNRKKIQNIIYMYIYTHIYICVYIFKPLWNQYFLISVDFQLVSGNDFLKYQQKRKSRMLFFKFTPKTGTRPR